MVLKHHLLLVLESKTVYLVILKSVNPFKFSSQKSKSGLLKNLLQSNGLLANHALKF